MIPTINYYSLQHSVSNINETFIPTYLPKYVPNRYSHYTIILYKIRKNCRTHGFRVGAAAFENSKPDRKTMMHSTKVYKDRTRRNLPFGYQTRSINDKRWKTTAECRE